MSLRVLPEAETEIREATAWYEERETGLGADFANLVREALGEIEAKPENFAPLETNRTKRNIRRVLLHRFPYVIIYEIADEHAVVLAVSHGRRRPGYWRSRGR